MAPNSYTPVPPGSGEHEAEDRRKASAVFDPRVDRVITWGLTSAVAVALAIGAWFFSGLNTGMVDLKREIGDLRVQLGKVESDRRDIEDLKKEFSELRAQFVTFQLSNKR